MQGSENDNNFSMQRNAYKNAYSSNRIISNTTVSDLKTRNREDNKSKVAPYNSLCKKD